MNPTAKAGGLQIASPPQEIITETLKEHAGKRHVGSGKIFWMISRLPTGSDRDHARRLLQRRLQHPEYNASTTTTELVGPVHPRSSGRNYANSVAGEPLCARVRQPSQ